MKVKGVTMHLGERFCTGGKRARRFSGRDPKFKTPQWCPKRKSPCEVRIYDFCDSTAWYLHERICTELGKDVSPSGRHYKIAMTGQTKLSPKEFSERCETESVADLIGGTVPLHGVVEIDDGIKPVFFYKTQSSFEVVLFDAEHAAKKDG